MRNFFNRLREENVKVRVIGYPELVEGYQKMSHWKWVTYDKCVRTLCLFKMSKDNSFLLVNQKKTKTIIFIKGHSDDITNTLKSLKPHINHYGLNRDKKRMF